MQIERTARTALMGLVVACVGASASQAQAACGDGVLEASTESCDDGNVVMGDGCNASCQSEAGYLCTGAPSLCCFAEASAAFVLQGDSTYDASTGEITLAPNVNNKVGVAWFRQTLDFTRPFTLKLRLYLGDRDVDPFGNAATTGDTGADGGAVLFQRDPRGTTTQGTYGGELGAQGILPVVGVEFDTYNNLATYNDVTTGDEDHVSVFHTRATPASNHLTPPVCMNNGTTCSNFEDGRYHVFAVEWTGSADHHLKVFVDGVQRVDIANDLVADYFAGDPKGIFFGFAASTGGYRNLHKFCPAAPIGYTLPRDADKDGIDDGIDLDDDNDGRPDRDETNATFGNDDPSDDHDRDGVPNYRDPDYYTTVLMRPQDCPDVVAPIGACDSLPKPVDFDADGVPDHLDPDSDGDTFTDAEEDGGLDANRDGVLDGCSPILMSGLCPGTRPALPDTDGDGAIDSRDVDSDGDGTPDAMDPARLDPCIPSATVAVCKSGDTDMDGLSNGVECPDAKVCIDTNGDGKPDYLDPDQDGDGVLDGADPAPRDPCIPDAKNARCPTADGDADGTPNMTDPAPTDPCVPDKDALACASGDKDGDGVPNGSDSAPMDPCIPNASSAACPGDRDGDGAPNMSDPAPMDPCVPDPTVLVCAGGDKDGDGLRNDFECPGLSSCRDTDGDGRPDYDDGDSDGDGVPDAEECEDQAACADSDEDADGLPDLLDPDRPQLAGGACSLSATAGSLPSVGWLFATLIAWLFGRRWRQLGQRQRASEQAGARDA